VSLRGDSGISIGWVAIGIGVGRAMLRWNSLILGRLCGLMVRVPGYRSRGTSPIPGATRFSDK
jgi:hypothetical protein